jgi:hypothetical protein
MRVGPSGPSPTTSKETAMEYTLWGLVVIQAIIAYILWTQDRQLEAQGVIVAIAMQDMIDKGILIVTEEEEDDEY